MFPDDIDHDWESNCVLYDPEPYRKAFVLENMVVGGCCIGGIACYTMNIERTGDCRFLFELWPTACYCGPEFVRKYHIPKRR